MKALAAHADSIKGTARSPTPACMDRMRHDHAQLNALKTEYENAKLGTQLNADTALNLMLSCVGGSRSARFGARSTISLARRR